MQNNRTKPNIKDLTTVPRRWFPLWRLDGYILREFLIKYSILMLVFIILFILGDVFDDVQDFLEARADWRQIVLYLLCKLPGNIRFILPITMLLGCMWTMAEFGKNLEVTAMRASGVSLLRCGGSIFAVGLIVTGVYIYFNETLIPFTQNKAEEIYDQAADKRKSVHYLLAFRSDDGKRHWLFSAFVNGNVQKNVTIKTVWNKKMIPELVGVPGSEKFNANLKAVFKNRSQLILSNDQAGMQQLLERELDGRKMDITAETVSYDSKKHQWVFTNGRFVSYDRTDELRFEASRGTSMMHGDIKFDKLTFSEDMMPETPRDIISSVSEKDDLPTFFIAELIRRSPNMPERVKAIYMSVFFYRLAFPWACFLSVFLGIPLATKNERTGSIMAIITAVALIVFYIVTSQVFLTFGKGGVLNPFIAGVGPTVAFIAASAWKLCTDRT